MVVPCVVTVTDTKGPIFGGHRGNMSPCKNSLNLRVVWLYAHVGLLSMSTVIVHPKKRSQACAMYCFCTGGLRETAVGYCCRR